MAEIRTNDQIDKANEFRKEHGMDILPYETEQQNNDISDEEKQKLADAETERLRIEAEVKANEGNTDDKKEETKQEDTKPTKVVLTKEEKEAIAMELFGVTDLKDLVKKSEIKKEPTSEEIEAAKEQRENDKIAYALKNGKVSRKQYENFISDSKDPISLVLAQYSKEQKELDPTLTDQEIEDEFNSKFGLDTKEDTRQYKRGLKEINLLADNILKQTYGKIYEIDSEYSIYENEQLTQKQLSEKLISEAPIYKQTIEDIYKDLKKIPIDLGDGEKYEVEMPDDVINALKERELDTNHAAREIQKGYTKENKAIAAKLALIYENLPSIIKSVADKINYKKQAGTKGIPPIGDNNPAPPPKKLTEAQEKILKEFKETHGVPVAN